jgi:pimeloyl-ACP methyl ester carboxylesterase
LSQTPTFTIGSAGSVRLPDGRAMTFFSAGPEDGFPVIYCHGAIGGLRYRVPLVPFGPGPARSMLAHVCLRALGLKGDTPTGAMIEDYLVCRRHWGFDPAEMRVPVTVWHGGSDRLVPLAHARVLAAAIPQCTARVAPEGGHFFYSRWLAEIFGSLVPVENLVS